MCSTQLYDTTGFDVGTDYYWPSESYFAAGWYHVRRMASASWLYMYSASNNVYSDTLTGSAVSQSLDEIIAYRRYSPNRA